MTAETYLQVMDALQYISTRIGRAQFSGRAQFTTSQAMKGLLADLGETIQTAEGIIDGEISGIRRIGNS